MLVKEGCESTLYRQEKGLGLKSGSRHKSSIISIFQLLSVTSVPTLSRQQDCRDGRTRAMHFLARMVRNEETTLLDFTSLSCAFRTGSSTPAFVHSRLNYSFRIH